MLYPSAPLRRLVRVGSSGVAPIKGTVADEWEKGLFPGYSASGQDVWLPLDQAPFTGDGLVVSAVGARCGKVFLATERWGVTANTTALIPRSDLVDARFLWRVVDNADFWTIGGSAQPYVQMDRSLDSEVPLPPVEEQRRIADFLDDQVARLDESQTIRECQSRILNEHFLLEVAVAVGGGDGTEQALPMSREWLGALPADWQVKTIGSEFDLKLGKMLNQERMRGDYLAPYLRNTNVQWDRIDVDDLSEMDFPPEEQRRYEVLRGDLLICEGGQPGRAAVWEGDVSPIYYQKALHRARPRRDAEPRWLLYCLRTAVEANYFAVENSTTTIAHLTGEQLSATRIPFPSPQTQRAIVSHLDQLRDRLDGALTELSRSGALLEERKRALITAAVTGEMDVTTAKPINMGRWVPGVGADVPPPAATTAPTLGGI